MNDLEIEQSIKEVIQNIFNCSGEPYSASDAVVHILYKHIRLIATMYATDLQTELPKLADFVHTFQTRPIELVRIAKYFLIVSTSRELTSSTDINPVLLDNPNQDSEQQPTDDPDMMDFINDFSPKTGWSRFIELCNKAQIDLPNNHDLFEIELQHMPSSLIRGRRLRLSRMDDKIASTSSDDYVSFSRLRQSASFLKFVRRRLNINFWHWLYNHNTNTNSMEINLKNPDVREGIRLFAYLLTAHVWDVIDMALSRRQALKIDLKSPLTPIEIKESVRQLQKLILQNSKDL